MSNRESSIAAPAGLALAEYVVLSHVGSGTASDNVTACQCHANSEGVTGLCNGRYVNHPSRYLPFQRLNQDDGLSLVRHAPALNLYDILLTLHDELKLIWYRFRCLPRAACLLFFATRLNQYLFVCTIVVPALYTGGPVSTLSAYARNLTHGVTRISVCRVRLISQIGTVSHSSAKLAS